jgi:hypothetical protein
VTDSNIYPFACVNEAGMNQEFKNPVTRKIADFLKEIGIEVRSVNLDVPTFLPGILVENGTILADESKLNYPGDLLHEAGHLAMAPASLRPSLSGEVTIPDVRMETVEIQTIAWSYAAMVHLGLDPKVVFHEGGYGVESERLLFNFRNGVYIGINGLVDAGLTVIGEKATAMGVPEYPHMLKWLRD